MEDGDGFTYLWEVKTALRGSNPIFELEDLEQLARYILGTTTAQSQIAQFPALGHSPAAAKWAGTLRPFGKSRAATPPCGGWRPPE